MKWEKIYHRCTRPDLFQDILTEDWKGFSGASYLEYCFDYNRFIFQ